jgi:hypothetical protein
MLCLAIIASLELLGVIPRSCEEIHPQVYVFEADVPIQYDFLPISDFMICSELACVILDS